MSTPSDSAPESPYPARRRRAIELLGTRLAAEEMLGFLVGVIELQSRVYDWVLDEGVGSPARPPDSALPWSVDLALLPVKSLLPEFHRFAEAVAPIATRVLAETALSLAAAPNGAVEAVVAGFLRQEALDDQAAELGVDPVPLGFFPRAFIQPVVETLRSAPDRRDTGALTCPTCGRRPLVSIFRDEADRKNARYLCCSLCAQEWSFRRLTCGLCGETDSKALFHHVAEDAPHVRLDECQSCRRYLKGIDLRLAGAAVPVVDEVASVELDLWARERGLEKGCPNLLGM